MTKAPTRASETDASVRRVERDSAIACVVMAALALLIQRGGYSGALGVIGGGALMAYSFRAIRGGVDVLVQRTSQQTTPDLPSRPGVALIVARFVLRYAVIGVVAWVLLVLLRAHPIGLFAGVTAPVIALTAEAVRLHTRASDS